MDDYIDVKTTNTYGWIDHIVTLNFPLSYSKNDSFQKYSTLESADPRTIMKYVVRLGESLRRNSLTNSS